jgi:hypothetical protein
MILPPLLLAGSTCSRLPLKTWQMLAVPAAKAERHTSLRTLGNTNARNTKSTAPAAASVPAVLNTVLAPENAAQSIDDLFSSLELQQSLLN